MTQRIPHAVNSTFLSYTYANISGGVLEDGSAFFSQPTDQKPSRIFDPELDPSSQDYIEGSYDLIIAFWVIHATTNLYAQARFLFYHQWPTKLKNPLPRLELVQLYLLDGLIIFQTLNIECLIRSSIHSSPFEIIRELRRAIQFTGGCSSSLLSTAGVPC